jgi:signal transduction histidine kinase
VFAPPRMVSNVKARHVAWLLPTLVLALSGAALFWGAWERSRTGRELEQMYRVHVESVSRLIREGARQAASSIDLMYALSEQRLESAVQQVSGVSPNTAQYNAEFEAARLSVLVTERKPDGFVGKWGPIVEPERQAFVHEMLKAEPREIVETYKLRRLGQYCAHFELETQVDRHALPQETGRETTRATIACQPSDDLVGLRREIGIGPLLREVAQRGVVYAAIQDKSGVIASSSKVRLSSWDSDAELARVFDRAGEKLSFRLLKMPAKVGGNVLASTGDDGNGARLLFEGLGRFALPDGSYALLRVGVDAAYLVAARAEMARRYWILWFAVGLIFLLSVAGASLISVWDKRRERAEQQLATREQESRWLQSMAQMAATVAHEVRSPLNTIKMIAQRLSTEFELPEASQTEYHEIVGLLRSEADRVDKVVGEFVELGRPIKLTLETVTCGQALHQALMPLQLRAASEGIRLAVEAPADDLVRLDVRRFGQIVGNLVSNALDAVGPTGTVRVVTRCRSDGLHLLIDDDGTGMSAEQLEQAQRPFVTTKAKGTGLGLPLAMRLAEAHGGKVTLSSTPGQGTRAELFIPGANGPTDEPRGVNK